MHGLINRSIERFLTETYGGAVWRRISDRLGTPGFEAMLSYDDAVTEALLTATAEALGKPVPVVLDDLGGFLAQVEPLRRLLRFGGTDFPDFLFSLAELQGRARMAVPDIGLPAITVEEHEPGAFRLAVMADRAGWAHVLAGLMRTMADDYGALVVVGDVQAGESGGPDRVDVLMLDGSYATGRTFDLAAREAG